MPKTNDTKLIDFIKSYTESWYTKDIEKVRPFYSDNNDELVYFDNHKDKDTYTVDDHLALLSDFFRHGKDTESGGVEELLMENIVSFKSGNSACVCIYASYKSFPKPAVRSTLYLEKDNDAWRIKHAHYSFEPDR
jgi:ketosteroid isomerase-like protein